MQKGFSLLELMIVIAITAGIVSLIIPQISKYNNLQVLQDAGNQLQTSVKVAQNNSLGGVACNSDTSVKAINWQLIINSNTTYKITANCQTGVTPLVKNYNLPENVSIKDNVVTFDSSCTLNVSASPKVIFNNITGETSFDGGSGCPKPSKMTITLKHNSVSNKTVKVIIDKGTVQVVKL